MNKLDYLIEELIKENPNLSNIEIPTNIDEKKDLYRALRNIRNPKPISEDYLRIQDEYLKEEIKNKGIIDEKDIAFDKDIISIWQGDITTLKCDVIVNACNEYLIGCFNPTHRCIDNTIHSFAGMQLREECNNIMKGKTLPNGEVVLTNAYNLPSKYIIQTVGPQVDGMPSEKDKDDLRKCYYNSLELCKDKGLKTIAFPCIATGLYGFPKEEASKIAISTVKEYLKANPNAFNHIIFNVFKDEDLEIYKKNIKGGDKMTDIVKIKKWIDEADAIIIGAGAGLSDAAGIHYSGKKFEHDFIDFIRKYGIKDLYTSSFYPFRTEEEKWAYWAKHIYFSYYENKHTDLYQNLYNLVKDKNYFVITTNTDGQFINNGFDKEKVFEVQGSYSKLQCSTPCHNKLYDNEEQVKEWLSNIDSDLKIPSNLVPKCPVCGENMSVNLRCDDTFVEDDNWYKMQNKYDDFIKNNSDKNVLLLEFGIGFNTPGIIRFPFEQMTFMHDNFKLIRFNDKYAMIPNEIQDRSISVTDSISETIDLVEKLK